MVQVPSIARRAGNAAWVARDRNLGERERDELAELFGEPWDALADATAFITRFLSLITNQADRVLWASTTVDYLTTEGRTIDADVEGDGTTLNARHLLYWLDKVLKRNKSSIGYTNRLSEASGWGEAAPTTLTEADPLGLIAALEGLAIKVVIVDRDAATSGDNTTAGAQNGCVRIPKAGHVCQTVNAAASKSYESTDALLNSSSGYRYRFWLTLDDLNEAAGSKLRFPNAAVESIVLARYSTTAHTIDGSSSPSNRNQLGCTTPGQTQNTRITISGYSGEFPVLSCYNPETTHNTGTIWVSAASDKLRKNVHWRNLDFVGKYLTAGPSTYTFATTILVINGNSDGTTQSKDHSVRFCRFSGYQPISDADALAAANPTFVDSINSTRAADPTYGAISANSPNLLIDSCYFEAAPVAAFPGGVNTAAGQGIDGLSIDIGSTSGDNTSVTRCTFAGIKHASQIRGLSVDGLYIADNNVAVYDKQCFSLSNLTNALVENNFIHHYANSTYATEGGGNGIALTGCSDTVVRNNTIYNVETMLAGGGITIQATTPYVTTANIEVYGNIFYRAGVRFDHNDTGTTTGCDVYNNLVSGMPETLKGSALTNAPVYVSMNRTGSATLEGNTIRENNIWRFATGTPNQSAIETGDHLLVRISAGASTGYETTEALTGWTDNTQVGPVWAGDQEAGDMRLAASNAFVGWFSGNMPFRAADSKAWSPS